jgi:hypothetical protein
MSTIVLRMSREKNVSGQESLIQVLGSLGKGIISLSTRVKEMHERDAFCIQYSRLCYLNSLKLIFIIDFV